MNDKQLLIELLEAEYEDDVIGLLSRGGLFEEANSKRWVPLGNMPNNQSIVHAQQSNPAAALVEKFTNGLDAILLRRCKAQGVNPRSAVAAPPNMSKAVQKWFGDLSEKSQSEIRTLAEESLVLYATGSKSRPCLSLYDAGEGQLPESFPGTFCSLIYGSDEGSYKGAISFVQGRFNMGGTGVPPVIFFLSLLSFDLISSQKQSRCERGGVNSADVRDVSAFRSARYPKCNRRRAA